MFSLKSRHARFSFSHTPRFRRRRRGRITMRSFSKVASYTSFWAGISRSFNRGLHTMGTILRPPTVGRGSHMCGVNAEMTKIRERRTQERSICFGFFQFYILQNYLQTNWYGLLFLILFPLLNITSIQITLRFQGVFPPHLKKLTSINPLLPHDGHGVLSLISLRQSNPGPFWIYCERISRHYLHTWQVFNMLRVILKCVSNWTWMTPLNCLVALNWIFFLTYVLIGIRIDRHNQCARENKKVQASKNRNRYTTQDH